LALARGTPHNASHREALWRKSTRKVAEDNLGELGYADAKWMELDQDRVQWGTLELAVLLNARVLVLESITRKDHEVVLTVTMNLKGSGRK
jgi:hypothetical protein